MEAEIVRPQACWRPLAAEPVVPRCSTCGLTLPVSAVRKRTRWEPLVQVVRREPGLAEVTALPEAQARLEARRCHFSRHSAEGEATVDQTLRAIQAAEPGCLARAVQDQRVQWGRLASTAVK